MNVDDIFEHDGSEFAPGWYIHTTNGGIGPFPTKEKAEEHLKAIKEIV